MGVGPIRRMTPADLGLDPRAAGLQDGRVPLGGMNVPLSQIARSFRPPGNSNTGNTETSIWSASGSLGSTSSTAGTYVSIPMSTITFRGGDDTASVESSAGGLVMSDGLWHFDIGVGVWPSDADTDVGILGVGGFGTGIAGDFPSHPVLYGGGTHDAQVVQTGSGIAIGGSSGPAGIIIRYRLFAPGGGTLDIDSAQVAVTLHRLTSEAYGSGGG